MGWYHMISTAFPIFLLCLFIRMRCVFAFGIAVLRENGDSNSVYTVSYCLSSSFCKVHVVINSGQPRMTHSLLLLLGINIVEHSVSNPICHSAHIPYHVLILIRVLYIFMFNRNTLHL